MSHKADREALEELRSSGASTGVATQVTPQSPPNVSILKLEDGDGNIHMTKVAVSEDGSVTDLSVGAGRRKKAAAAAFCLLVGCAAAIAIGLAVTDDNNSNKSDDDSEPPPFVVAVSGGGFKTMTQAMGVARAIGDNWPQVSHLGGNSGGSWFSNQMQYSKTFYADMRSPDLPIEDVVRAWGEAYVAAEDAVVAEGAYWAVTPPSDPTLPYSCIPAMFSVRVLFAGAISVGLAAQNWLPWVWTMLQPSIGPDARTARYSEKAPEGLTTATTVTQVAIPPDVYLDGHARLAKRYYADAGNAPEGFVMPAAFVVPRDRAEAPHWQLKGGAGSLTAGVEGEATTPLLSEDPGLAEVMAASSAAQGLLGSQTMFDAMIQQGLAPYNLSSYPAECVPFALEGQAVPVLPEDFSMDDLDSASSEDQYDGVQAATRYRLIDGGYVDNTAAAATLARAQKDCAAGSERHDCSAPYKLLLVVADMSSADLLFAGGTPANSFSFASEFQDWTGPVPSQQIFLEARPGDTWADVASVDYTAATADSYFTEPSYSSASLTPQYWRGTVTTVDNEWYGVTEGTDVDLLILRSNAASDQVPIVAATSWAVEVFEKTYAPIAASMAELGPVVDQWLDGSLPMAEDSERTTY